MLPTLAVTTELDAPKLSPKNVMEKEPLVGPFLGVMLDMDGALYENIDAAVTV